MSRVSKIKCVIKSWKWKNGMKKLFASFLTWISRTLVILRFLTLTFRVKFVVDHIAKPYVKDQVGFDKWSAEMKEISQYQNVWCKM